MNVHGLSLHNDHCLGDYGVRTLEGWILQTQRHFDTAYDEDHSNFLAASKAMRMHTRTLP